MNLSCRFISGTLYARRVNYLSYRNDMYPLDRFNGRGCAQRRPQLKKWEESINTKNDPANHREDTEIPERFLFRYSRDRR